MYPTTAPRPTSPAPTTSVPAITPRPTSPATTVPAPTTRPTTTPTTRPTTRPSVPAVKAVQRTFQVDRYMPKTAAQARVVARLDDDGVLRYREDRALWGANNWQFVTVRVPADASKAQVMAVINAKTSSRVGDVHTGSRLRSITRGRSVTIAWELGKGARPTSAWGANKSSTRCSSPAPERPQVGVAITTTPTCGGPASPSPAERRVTLARVAPSPHVGSAPRG